MRSWPLVNFYTKNIFFSSDAMTLIILLYLKYCTTSSSIIPEKSEHSCLAGLNDEKEIVSAFLLAPKDMDGLAKPPVDFCVLLSLHSLLLGHQHPFPRPLQPFQGLLVMKS